MCTHLYWIDLRFLVSVERLCLSLLDRLCYVPVIELYMYLNKYMYKIMMQACTL